MKPIEEKIREILIDLINAQAGAMGDMPIEQLSLDEALSAILSLVRGEIPKGYHTEVGDVNFRLGYNKVLTDLHKKFE